MDPITTQPRQDAFVTPTSSQRAKSLENNEPAIETQSDNAQNDSSKVSHETVKLSDTSLKLSSSSPVKSSDEFAQIESKDQARQVLDQLLSDFQSNPAQAQAAHSNVFSSSVKSLLG
jgi:glycine betaine/choline ABC-type transport system substrate-binding protein